MLQKGTALYKIGLTIGFIIFAVVSLIYTLSVPATYNQHANSEVDRTVTEFKQPYEDLATHAAKIQHGLEKL